MSKHEDRVDEVSDLNLTCANCSFWEHIIHPKTKESTGTGFCFANPPTVLLVPIQKQVALQGQNMALAPQMFRVATAGEDRYCGHYSPNREAAQMLDAREKAAREGEVEQSH